MKNNNKKNKKRKVKDLFILQLIVGCVGIFIISFLVGRFLGNYVIKSFPQYYTKPELKLTMPKDYDALIKNKKEPPKKDDEKIEKRLKYKLQIAAFKNNEGATKLIEELNKAGYEATIVKESKSSLYKVRVNIYDDKELEELDKIYPDCFIVE